MKHRPIPRTFAAGRAVTPQVCSGVAISAMNGMGELLRFGQRGYVCQSGKTTLKFNGAIQTRETGKLFVPPQFSWSPRERQSSQALVSNANHLLPNFSNFSPNSIVATRDRLSHAYEDAFVCRDARGRCAGYQERAERRRFHSGQDYAAALSRGPQAACRSTAEAGPA